MSSVVSNVSQPPPSSSNGDDSRHLKKRFLLRAGELLHKYGTPSYRLENAMESTAQRIGLDATFIYTPTLLIASFHDAQKEDVHIRRVADENVDLHKLLEFDDALERLCSGQISVSQANKEIDATSSARPLYSESVRMGAAAIACGAVAFLLGGWLVDVVVSMLLGSLLHAVDRFGCRRGWTGGWIASLSGFVVALSSASIAHYIGIDHRLTTLAALILPLPGLSFTISFAELAVGHLSAGSARLAGASVKLLILVLGVAIAWQFTNVADGAHHANGTLPEMMWVAAVAASFSFSVLLGAPVSLWAAIALTCVAGFGANQFAQVANGAEFGAFCGACVVGICSNLYARKRNRPAMALFTPGILILVPGSVGYRALTAMLESDTLQGVELAFSMVMVGVSLVGGILAANVILSPKRSL